MDSEHANAIANLVVAAVVLLGSYLQLLARASDFKPKEQQRAEKLIVRLADNLNDRASIIVLFGAFIAYCVAAVAFVWIWDLDSEQGLYITILSPIVIAFGIAFYYLLRTAKAKSQDDDSDLVATP